MSAGGVVWLLHWVLNLWMAIYLLRMMVWGIDVDDGLVLWLVDVLSELLLDSF